MDQIHKNNSNAENDKKEREKVETLNKADNTIFQTEKQIKEFGDKLTEQNKSDLESVLTELKTAHKDQNIDVIDPTINKLNEVWSKISTDLYSQSQTQTETQANAGEAQDVSYEEVK